VFSQTKEKIATEAITSVVKRSKAVTLSGSDGPLMNLMSTSSIDIPISIIAKIIALSSIAVNIN
jgi:hypothetical protein